MNPPEITGGVGNLEELNLTHAPRRVVSLVPSVSESLFALGAGQSLAAVTDFCVHPAEEVARLPKVGGTKNPDLRLVKAALPELIIANQEENRKEDIEALQAEGLKVWVTFPCTAWDAIQLLWALVQVFRVPQLGQSLSVLETAWEWANLAAQNTPPAKVFCPIWREPDAAAGQPRWWMTINRDTYVHDVLRLSGGENIFADRLRHYPLGADLGEAAPETPVPERDVRYPRVTPTEIAAHAPDVILLPSEPFPFTEADLSAFDAYPEIPAVKHQRIYLVDGSLLTWPGIRLAKALGELPAYFIRPDAATLGESPDAAVAE
jgi:ABC-type Fe3+-hydroxamate transport system substrate-binding protein